MIYVDSMRACMPTPLWKWSENCHLSADTLEELHDFAKKLGLRKRYLDDKPSHPHYDLTQNKRRLAVKMGAREV